MSSKSKLAISLGLAILGWLAVYGFIRAGDDVAKDVERGNRVILASGDISLPSPSYQI